MFGFDDIQSNMQTLEFVVINNGNQIKQYQTIIKNISLDQFIDGQITMKVFDNEGKLMLTQGPKKYHTHPIGTVANHEGKDKVFQEWEFGVLGDDFTPGLQCFVVWNAKDTRQLGSEVQKFTSFFTPEEEEITTLENLN